MREKLGWNDQIKETNDVYSLLREAVNNHKENFDDNNPKDFIDMVLIEMKTEDPSSSFYGKKGEENLLKSLYDIFMAGTETTSSSLTWCVLYMLLCSTLRCRQRYRGR